MRFLNKIIICASFVLTSTQLLASYDFNSSTESLAVNNRILLKLGDKTITVIDLKRKMDLLIYRSYPAAAASESFRYQFYLANWEHMLKSLIDETLILADAREKKVGVSDGDIREELEKLFGPDVVLNIEKAGLKRKEAWEMLKKELVCQKILGPMVHVKAFSDVPPAKVRKTYEAYLEANPPQESWHYRVVTISGGNAEQRKAVSDAAYSLLNEQKVPFEKIVSTLEEEKITPSAIFVRVSDEYTRQESEISLGHKAILQTLNIGALSAPQITTVMGGDEVNRLFFLKEHTPATPPLFSELEKKIKSELTRIAVGKRSEEYLSRLRVRFGIDDDYLKATIPDDFAPFSLN